MMGFFMKHIYIFAIFLFLITCQSAPKKEVSMYDVSSDMKRNDQVRAEKETIQSSPQMKKKEYNPAETVFITTLTFASIPASVIEFDLKQRKHNEINDFSFFQVENDDMFMIEGRVRTKEKSNPYYCIFNMNCSESLERDKEEKSFLKIKFPGLME
jgi:hypothetical protein